MLFGCWMAIRNQKKEFEQKEREQQKEFERREREQQKEFEQRERESRREYLVNVIRDESWGIGPRKLAATEYLQKGYNGLTKQFIMDNKLIDESFFEVKKDK